MMRKRLLRLFALLFFLLLLITALSALRSFLSERERHSAEKAGFAPMVSERDPLLLEFQKRYPERSVILACGEDITGDGRRDLVVISGEEERIESIVLYWEGEELRETEAVPAPRENQKIKFFDMDRIAPLETLITGEKNGKLGYAVYRIIDGSFKDLFGEGMKDCC